METTTSTAGSRNDNGKRLATEAVEASDGATAQTSYYDKGSVELAIETPVLMERLEKRRRLAGSAANDGAECLLIVLVGLPARGKSFIARKLLNTLTWRGNQCKIFNVGKYRRKITKGQSETEDAGEQEEQEEKKEGSPSRDCSKSNKTNDADFFDDANQEAARLRLEAAAAALHDSLDWLDGDGKMRPNASNSSILSNSSSQGNSDHEVDVISGSDSHSNRRQYHRIAILDATNSTNERRKWILTVCAQRSEQYKQADVNKRIGVLFVESICDDPDLLAENFRVKISSCPDFDGLAHEEALHALKSRIQKYESRYETIENSAHQSFIKIFNLNRTLMVNHVYGRLAKVVLPAIMAWNTGSRPIYLSRAGETAAMEQYMKQKDTGDNKLYERRRSDRLGQRGLRFRDALCSFIEREGVDFMTRRNENVVHPTKMGTGTSISGLYERRDRPLAHQSRRILAKTAKPSDQDHPSSDGDSGAPRTVPSFPCLVMSSTLPRAVETATWKENLFPVKDVSNLNPLDMGDFSGMTLAAIEEKFPEWFRQLKEEPFYTRFLGGESYSDLIDRLYSVVIDTEQQLGPALVVSHVSVLQVLVSYFRNTPIRQCMDIQIPMHTVLKFTPLRGGGWLESQHTLLDDDSPEVASTAEKTNAESPSKPIWGDSRSCMPHRL
mmetsp:Transcript_7447/g.20652  ORF Transcript_7447/g.20652 Transcript_7447/m.20652 type:complete len:668 (+) Transcript_7447:64-2067(+)